MFSSIEIFTDGASKGNPGPGGFGVIIATPEKVVELGGREEHTTNNRMELCAAIEAFVYLRSGKLKAKRYKLFSDSAYLVNGMTKWVHSWQKKNWINAQKKPVENRDLWERLVEVSAGLDVKWQQVAGHSDTPGNARCDEIASMFAETGNPKLFSGARADYKVDLSLIGESGSVRGEKGFYVSLVGGVIRRHASWDECEALVKGKTGARFKKVRNDGEARALVTRWQSEDS